ncbi:MAG: hypothetical protein ACK4V1_07415 [Burkholderiaceae bacterium]
MSVRHALSRAFLIAGTVVVAGCASTYELTLMPRTAGKLYYGEAVQRGSQADVSVTIEGKTYTGTWVEMAPDRTTGYVSGWWGWRRSGIGTTVTVDNPAGGEAKALLQAADGSGLRCDIRGMAYGRSGGGTCQDDKGLVYDVQIRLKENK